MAAIIGVAGLAFEARIAGGRHTRAICGSDGSVLATSLARAITGDCRGLISFGFAGGLLPDLGPGACVVASSVVCEAGRFVTDRSWSRNVLERIPDATQGAIVGVSTGIVANPSDKRALHARTGAIAVDSESHVVANVAATHGLPMAAVRVIMDPAKRQLPEGALVAVRENGTIDLAALMQWLVKKPGELPTLLRTAADALIGLAALLRCRRLLGSALGLPSLHASEAGLGPNARIPTVAIWNAEDEHLERP